MLSQNGAPPRRPKLSLTIKSSHGPNLRSASRALAAIDPKSPTAFNTLSNVYVTAIERSTPVTAINTLQQTQQHHAGVGGCGGETKDRHPRVHTPYAAVAYPETPLTANPSSPSAMEISFPSVMTSTPPMSAGPTEPTDASRFTFKASNSPSLSLTTSFPPSSDGRTPRRRATTSNSASWMTFPYSHTRSLHSILRNSPLPPRTVRTPISPRRQSLRLQEKAARRVAYNSPIEQTIITNKYTKSHIDLLIEDASPNSPAASGRDSDTVLDLALAFTGNETRDGGQTPGPFEEMRRRMAGLVAATPVTPVTPSSSGGIRKKKRREKKRCWVWTIGQEGEEGEGNGQSVDGTAAAATRIADARASSEPAPDTAKPACGEYELLTPSVESAEEVDVEMMDAGCAVVSGERERTPWSVEADAKTPLARVLPDQGATSEEQSTTGPRRDTPVPPDMFMG